jgi:predicted DNA-binding protein
MLSIGLNPEIGRRLSELAKRSGTTEADYAR